MAAEITAGFLGPALQVVKWVSAPILRQFKYLCCFTTNITNLENEAKKLQDAERYLQGRVEAARNDVQLIASEVETWLQNFKEIIIEEDGITKEVPKVKCGCLQLRARFSLSKRAVKTADRLKELRDLCKFDVIFRPRPPAAMEAVPLERTCEFESRKKIEEDIMTTLRGEDVNMVGICGMGGLGKTTMAKNIMNRALEKYESEEIAMAKHVKKQLFEEVVMAVVSRPIDKLKIQLEIGGSLGLKLQGETSQARVQKLHSRLSGPKRILLVLDDVWEKFKPEDLGIPRGYKECTILLTSRNRDVLNAMNVQKIFEMKVLSEEDSWLLFFKEKVGTSVDDTKLNSIAKEVVRKCAGLPIALITVGAALKGEVNVPIWENALQQLKINCTPDIPEYSEEVYNPLKLSYDVLERKYQDVFLLCCLYPEDDHIPLERLTYFCMGLRLLEGAIGNVEEARNRIRALTKVLKNRSLLLDSERGDEYVRMHDVVRDVCIHIARENKYISGGNSSLQRYGFELLQIRNSADEEIKGDGIGDLYVLSIERCSQLTSLPFTQRPNNLITLVLDSCRRLETLCDDRISSNSFQNLKILTLVELPVLRQLWESSQNDLEKDFLPQLEVLYISKCEMMEALFLWKGEEANENNSCHPITIRFPKLKELNLSNLPNLISLCQGIEGIEFPLMRKIEIIRCGKMKGMVWNEKISGGSSNNASIHAPQQVLFGRLKKLDTDRNPFSELEELEIFQCQGILSLFTSSMAGNLVNLQRLEISDCEEMVEVIKDDEEKGMSGGQNALLFPKLQTIKLWHLPNLLSFCKSKGIEISIEFPVLRSVEIKGCEKMKGMVANGLTSNDNNSGGSSSNAADTIHLICESQQVSFGCGKELETDWNPFCSHTIHVSLFNGLEVLRISKCAGSLSLFTSSIARNLVNLKKLSIGECDEMVEVIKDDEKKGMSCGRQRPLLLPKLHTLHLWYLPKLVSFCEWKCDIEFLSLRKVEIHKCPNMKNFTLGSLAAPNLKSFNTDLKDDLLQVPFISLKELSVEWNENPLNCYQIHGSVFDRLEVLVIRWYKGSMSLFSSSITGNLVNLTTLTIWHCHKMVKVIEEKEKVVSGAQTTTILFPKLQTIELYDLPKLVRFCEWKCDVELPSLTEMRIIRCYNMQSFTLGHLNTPKLESVEINVEEFGGVKDLNGLVQQAGYLSGEAEDEEEEEEEGEEEEEEEEEEDDEDGGGDDDDDEKREEQN